jgi:ribosome biogenesis GTPase
MTLAGIGYNERVAAAVAGCGRANAGTDDFSLARVIAEQKERYRIFTGGGERDAEITGNLRFTARSREDFPAVGDWVLVSPLGGDFAVIHSVLPRSSALRRKTPGSDGESQIIAANVDRALIVQAAGQDFNLNRLERYLAISGDAGVEPVIVITKIDLLDSAAIDEMREQIRARLGDAQVVTLSNETGEGLDALKGLIVKGKTHCLLGSSGVGKSTLLNRLSGGEIARTGATSDATNKGRHTTTSRELFVLEGGGIVIDNPGMREIGMTEESAGDGSAFPAIAALARECRFADCSHIVEAGCAVLAALSAGELDRESYANFLKLRKEREFFESSALERRRKDKAFGKMVNGVKKAKQDRRN